MTFNFNLSCPNAEKYTVDEHLYQLEGFVLVSFIERVNF